MKISYVLVCKNEQNTIAECVRSLLNQVVPVEIIVIDDGSTDLTQDILETFRKDIENTGKLILNKTSKGSAVRRNQGNKLATGDIIAVCDAEVYVAERSEAINEAFTKFDIDVFYSAYMIRLSCNLFNVEPVSVVEWDFKSKCTISHPTVAYKRKIALEHKYITKSKETDLFEFMLLDMKRADAKFGICENPLVLKIEGNSNRNMKKSKLLKQKYYLDYGIDIVLK